MGTSGPADHEGASVALSERHRQHWRRNLRLTSVLLAIWFVVTFVMSYFARELSFAFFGWPFSFWVAAQGALVVYVVLIGVYAWRMNALDHEFGVAEVEQE
jgi:putative solute:sodium symporter small subunit